MVKNTARLRLLKATEKIIVTEGVSSATIRHIAREAELNSALVSYYFTSLEGLISEVGELNLHLMSDAWNTHFELLEAQENITLPDVISAYIRPLWAIAALNEQERALLVLDEIVGHCTDSIRLKILQQLSENFVRTVALVQRAEPTLNKDIIEFRIQFISGGCLGVPPRTETKLLFAHKDKQKPERETLITLAIEAAIACFKI